MPMVLAALLRFPLWCFKLAVMNSFLKRSSASFSVIPTSKVGPVDLSLGIGRSSGRISLPFPITTARSIAFLNSRTLPGQSYSMILSMTSCERDKSLDPLSCLKMLRK